MSEKTEDAPWQGTRKCFHPDCTDWAPFGFNTRYGVVWYCGEHREIGKKECTPTSSTH